MIKGKLVTLRPAIPSDARLIYEWLVSSDLTSSMMGPPLFPEVLLPTWEQFCADYGPHFFDGSKMQIACSFIIEAEGKPIGHINYDGLDLNQRRTELDIWMRSSQHCGKGYGSDAIDALVRFLMAQYSVQEFVLRPSRRNPRAIRAYERAGFVQVDTPIDEQTRKYGKGDNYDDVLLIRRGAGTIRDSCLGTIETSRLELVASTVDLLNAELESNQGLESALKARVPDGWPPGEYDTAATRYFRDRLADDPEAAGWFNWYAILRTGEPGQGVLIGAGGFFGPPDRAGLLELGYSVLPAYERRGFATEIVEGLIRRAFLDVRVKRIVAHTTPANAASIKVLERAGFEYVGPGKDPGTVQYERRAQGT